MKCVICKKFGFGKNAEEKEYTYIVENLDIDDENRYAVVTSTIDFSSKKITIGEFFKYNDPSTFKYTSQEMAVAKAKKDTRKPVTLSYHIGEKVKGVKTSKTKIKEKVSVKKSSKDTRSALDQVIDNLKNDDLEELMKRFKDNDSETPDGFRKAFKEANHEILEGEIITSEEWKKKHTHKDKRSKKVA